MNAEGVLCISVRCLLFITMTTKKRHPKNSALAEQVKERLETLRKPDGKPELNYTKFAANANIPRSVYNAWRNSGRVPGGFYLRRVAESFGVTVDWLLCVPGAPKYPNQRLTDAELPDEVSAHVARAISAASKGAPWEEVLRNGYVDGAKFLSVGVKREIERIQKAWWSVQSLSVQPDRFAARFAGADKPASSRGSEDVETMRDSRERAVSSNRGPFFWTLLELGREGAFVWQEENNPKRQRLPITEEELKDLIKAARNAAAARLVTPGPKRQKRLRPAKGGRSSASPIPVASRWNNDAEGIEEAPRHGAQSSSQSTDPSEARR